LWDSGLGFTFTLIEHAELPSLTFTKDKDLVQGREYQFKVIAVNAIGDSPESVIFAVRAANWPA
jgi:hypothetical protein